MGTGLLAIATTIIVKCPRFANDITGNVLLIGLAVLVAIGAYLHAVRSKIVGLVMLLVGGIPITGISIADGLAGGLFLFCGVREGILILTPAALAIVTMIGSIVTRRARNKVAGT